MTINMNRDGENLTVALEGRLDTTTAPQLEGKLRPVLADGVENLTIDLETLDYVSSAGLRVLLTAQKIMNKQGEMTVRNVNDAVMEVFEVTGFVDLLNIE
ncbi:MAG: STAS domain-containing protein [Oscillospiraceae bacterium]|nr:STAS domain-containing protein [Oscillospiraceae bacterium]